MGLFKKKEKVPEIPLAPSLPDVSVESNLSSAGEYEVPELPSIPSNSKNEGLNQEIVKSAISDNFSPKEEEVIKDGGTNKVSPPPVLESPKVVSIPSIPGKSSIMDESSSGAIPQAPKKPLPKPTPPIYTKPKIQPKTIQQKPITPHFNVPVTSKACLDAEPVFIRIDKFQLARKNIEQMKTKIKEMEGIISKINQVKLKEEEEIKGWLEEVEKLKARLSEIDSDVFSQI
ncbi:MAG: hypothetical protein WC494_03300 [Candidatus Pacearchaeota archaeon]